MIRVLVTSSRTWDDGLYIVRVLDELLAEHGLLSLYHGACPSGGDAIADAWAVERQQAGANVLVHRFPANWGNYGRAAGMRRNAEMVAAIGTGGPVRCEAFVRDESRGASHCVKLARRAGIDTRVHRWEDRAVSHA
jgi:hypothetical protein